MVIRYGFYCGHGMTSSIGSYVHIRNICCSTDSMKRSVSLSSYVLFRVFCLYFFPVIVSVPLGRRTVVCVVRTGCLIVVFWWWYLFFFFFRVVAFHCSASTDKVCSTSHNTLCSLLYSTHKLSKRTRKKEKRKTL